MVGDSVGLGKELGEQEQSLVTGPDSLSCTSNMHWYQQ